MVLLFYTTTQALEILSSHQKLEEAVYIFLLTIVEMIDKTVTGEDEKLSLTDKFPISKSTNKKKRRKKKGNKQAKTSEILEIPEGNKHQDQKLRSKQQQIKLESTEIVHLGKESEHLELDQQQARQEIVHLESIHGHDNKDTQEEAETSVLQEAVGNGRFSEWQQKLVFGGVNKIKNQNGWRGAVKQGLKL